MSGISRHDPLDLDRLGSLGRRDFLHALATTGALASAGGLLEACSASSSLSAGKSTAPGTSGKPKPGGDLKVGLTGGSGSDTLDPHKALTYLDSARAQCLYQPLLQLNTAGQTEFVLAEDISPHGSTAEWVISLRRGITFQDGKPLTADDVIFTLRRVITEKLPGSTPLGPVNVNDLKALDSRTVLVPMTSPYGSFIDQLSYWYFLNIVPVGFNPNKPNGTGPFKYQSFTPGQRSVFVKNPNYWRPGLPYVDSITIIDFSDSVSLQNALTTGVIEAAGALEGPQIAVLKTTSGVQTVVSRSGAFTPFTMRVDQAPFNDVNVRQAMRLLVDRPQLINSALNGDGFVASDVFSPYDPDFDSALHRSQDIAQAKFLLKKAGQEKLAVQLVTSAIAASAVAMATVLQQQAKAAGVTINLRTVDTTTFLGPNYLHWTFAQDFYTYSPYLAQVAQSMLPTSPFNETHWSLPRYVSLYHQANVTANAAVRREIKRDMQLIDFNEGTYIIPAFIDALDAYSTKITGYSAAKAGVPLSNLDFEHFSFV
jgi:peptide/nickel transport system substrate-binding protein